MTSAARPSTHPRTFRTVGLARARAVCAALRHDGVQARYRTSSLATHDPLASNRTPQGQSLNRRVVICIIRR
jgi:outer membrane protein OmpA-like peptidoglycan-associated protein